MNENEEDHDIRDDTDIKNDIDIEEDNDIAKDDDILDAATAFCAGEPRLPEVLDRPGQHRPKAASHIDKNAGIANETVRMGD